eukprot:Gregarina_sp_Pseudo_9__3392@NODE_3565_length_611_cov_10_874126_g3259_i0_p2_GENE_NODE_3565_length_611_cov_10_874126_g3259_i0NODE_3565_length_611_cov_10_874126_g3259_i0_p2_ORF_typecomplete_len171_score42_53Sybindin/PF04099_12/3_4e32Sedlin_N/PF04628_13/1_4e05_NODE_3565_length_611_cov_10_874126_g3259_i074586
MPIYSLYINNKHGTLVYYRDLVAGNTNAPSLTANETIIVASTLHGMSGIAAGLCPKKVSRKVLDTDIDRRPPTKNPDLVGEILKSRGIVAIESEKMKVVSMETLTGLRIFLVSDPKTSLASSQQILQSVYDSYATHVLKNPFCDVDMPARLNTFDEDIDNILTFHNAQMS